MKLLTPLVLIAGSAGALATPDNLPAEDLYGPDEQQRIEIKDEGVSEMKFGLEGLTSYRTEYVHRGFQLAKESMEFQLAGQLALSDTSVIDLGLWYGTETGDGDFSEAGVFIDFTKNIGDINYTFGVKAQDYNNSFFESGAEFSLGVDWRINDHWNFKGTIIYDTGASGWYRNKQVSYYQRINDDSYVTFDLGVSLVSNYYGRDGFNDAHAKFSYTYNINSAVSVTPYLGGSLGIDREAEDHLFGGVYFAVSF